MEKKVPKKGKKLSMKPTKDHGHYPSMATSRADVVYDTMVGKKKGGK